MTNKIIFNSPLFQFNTLRFLTNHKYATTFDYPGLGVETLQSSYPFTAQVFRTKPSFADNQY